MTKIEQLKAAYEATPKATWYYDNALSAVVYIADHKVKVAADLGKIDNSAPLGEFITLAHNLMPTLLEAVEHLRELRHNLSQYDDGEWYAHEGFDPANVDAFLEKLK